MERTFIWNGATFRLHEETVASALDMEYVVGVLRQGKVASPRLLNHYITYGTFLASAELVEGDPGFPIPSLDADEQALLDGFAAYQRQPAALRQTWNIARSAEVEKKIETPAAPTPVT